MMAVNDLAYSSFAGVTAQLQVFGQIGIANTAAISDIALNIILEQPTTKKKISSKKTSLFHGFFRGVVAHYNYVCGGEGSCYISAKQRCYGKATRGKT